MSGKAPPRAPRALLNSLAGSAASSSSATATTSGRIGAAPPTGPRSLTNGVNGHFGLSSAKVGVRIKPQLNGHSLPTGPASISPPTGPRLKGKQLETPYIASSTSATQSNGAGPSRLTGELTQRSHPVSFRLRPAPPQPTTEPPPPPPPSVTPPPPPPPSSEPPPAPPCPPALPFEPSPPPPPSTEPPPPPPPSDDPPPSPPPPPTTEPPEQPRPPPVAPRSQRSDACPPPPPSPPPPPLPPNEPFVPSLSLLTAPGADKHPSSPPTPSLTPPPPPELPPLPPWPPAPEDCPPGKNYKVLFDYTIDKDRDGQIRMLSEKLRELGMDEGEEARVKGKGKGRELLFRYDGETIDGEHPAVLRDPRKEAKVKRLPTMRPLRGDFHALNYEYDTNSTGPPPPTAVLVTNLSPLIPNQHIRRCFAVHGTITSFEPQIDKATGGALGVVLVRYSSHEEARKCLEREHGKKLAAGVGFVNGGEEMAVVFDGEGKIMKAVLKEFDDRRRREREEKRKKEKEAKMRETAVAKGTPPTPAGQTPLNTSGPWRSSHPAVPNSHQQGARGPPGANLPVPLGRPASSSNSPMPAGPNGIPGDPKTISPSRIRRPPPSAARARPISLMTQVNPPLHWTHTLSAPGAPRGLHTSEENDADVRSTLSRSPSPVLRKPGQSSKHARQKEHETVVEELAKNGFNHVTLDGHGAQLGGAVREEDVRQFFDGFQVDKVLRDHLGWYVTFRTGDSARRAAMVLSSGARTLASHSVSVTVHSPPATPGAPAKTHWTDDELLQQAEIIVLRDLKSLLEKDIVDRVVGNAVKRIVADEKGKRGLKTMSTVNGQPGEQTVDIGDHRPSGLKGLSFRKQKRPREEESKIPFSVSEVALLAEPEPEDRPTRIERPTKRRRRAASPKITSEDVESEDEEIPETRPVVDVESEDEDVEAESPIENLPLKRATSEVSELEPVKKKPKIDLVAETTVSAISQKKVKKSTKKPSRAMKTSVTKEVVHEVRPDDFEFEVPTVTQVRLTPPPHYESSLSPSPPPTKTQIRVSQPVVLLDLIEEGICEDDEDVYFAKLAVSRALFGEDPAPTPRRVSTPDPDAPPPFRVHVTGSARTEGYYKISHAEKSAYVAQYVSRTISEVTPEVDPPQQSVTSSRSNRANARRRAQGLEEINQVQRAMALSKGESAAMELVKFNQLQTRKKHLRFARSPIHDWGLYAMEKISRGEMVIEYVGEIIRAQVADKREKAYERQGIGSSYLFRIDEDLVVDATKKGNLGRLINHSCDPNCTAKIITINGEKKIVIYAKQDIELGSEITYDYHFPIEQDKIPCLCGSAKCRGYLN